jgi:hypothetical protein
MASHPEGNVRGNAVVGRPSRAGSKGARRAQAAKLRGVRDLSAPFGKTSICPAGIKIEAASEDTTSKSKSSDIGILILKTATNTGRLTMVNDHSYWSVSDERSIAEISKRKWPLSLTAAERWEVSTSRGNDTIGICRKNLFQSFS